MALTKWTTGDTITEIAANTRGIRKGTESEIAGIGLSSREDGDHFWNSTYAFPQVQTDATNDKRGNLAILLGADSTEVSHNTGTPTQVKDSDFIKAAEGFSGNTLSIVAFIKVSAGTGHLRVRHDAGGTDDLDLSTTSTSYTKVTGQIDITGLSTNAVHTLEFYLDDSGGTVYLKQLEIYGI